MDELNAALAEIERLRNILLQCVRGPDMVELGDGAVIGLHLPHKSGESFAEIKRGLKIKSGQQAGTNTGDGVALTCAPHPSDEERS